MTSTSPGPSSSRKNAAGCRPFGQQISISFGDRRSEGIGLNDPAVHGDVQVAAGREADGERADEAPHHRSLERYQDPREREAMDLRDALPQVGRRGERQGAPPVRAEEEPDFGTAQGQRFDHRRYRVRLGPHRTQETAAHGKIQEQVASLHRRALRMGRRRRLDYLPGEDPHGRRG